MPLCPECNKPINEDQNYCPYCGKVLDTNIPIPHNQLRTSLFSSIKHALGVVKNNPILFLPELLASFLGWGLGEALNLILTSLLSGLNTNVTYVGYHLIQEYDDSVYMIGIAVILAGLLVSAISGIFTFGLFHLTKNVYEHNDVNFGDTLRYLKGRFVILYFASLIGSLLSLTVILVPAVIYMYSVMVIEETGIRNGLSEGFKISLNKILTSFGWVIIYMIFRLAVQLFLPYSDFFFVIPGTILTVASIDIYYNYKIKSNINLVI